MDDKLDSVVYSCYMMNKYNVPYQIQQQIIKESLKETTKRISQNEEILGDIVITNCNHKGCNAFSIYDEQYRFLLEGWEENNFNKDGTINRENMNGYMNCERMYDCLQCIFDNPLSKCVSLCDVHINDFYSFYSVEYNEDEEDKFRDMGAPLYFCSKKCVENFCKDQSTTLEEIEKWKVIKPFTIDE